MRILLTGAAGFAGHHVAKLLLDRGHEVVALVRVGKIGDLDRLASERFTGEVVWHDLRSPVHEGVARRIGEVDAIVHMGAETHVDRSIEDPVEFAMSNVVGTTNLLQFARKALRGAFLQFSTDEVFGPAPDGVAYKESDAHSPKNPYAASKSGAEQMVTAFANTYGLRTIIVRSMNLFGQRQHREKFIPLVIRSILEGKKISIHANKDLTRAGSRFYIHARTVADALDFLLRTSGGGKHQVYHVVGDREVDNLSLAKQIASYVGTPLEYEMVNFHESRPGHDLRYALQDTKLSDLGWKRSSSFDEDLRSTVRWYLYNKEWLGL